MQNKLDEIDRKILRLLIQDGRMSFAEIGRQVNLSLPAAAERVRRLEEAGIIEGYQAKVNYKKLGYPLIVFVELMIPATAYKIVNPRISEIPEIIDAYHVAGEVSLMLKLHLADLEDLEPIIEQLTPPGHSKSIVVLSTVVEKSADVLLNSQEKS